MYISFSVHKSAAVQCRGVSLHPVELQVGWPEDDTDYPPLSTAVTWQAPLPEPGRGSGTRAAMTSQDACNIQRGI